MTGEIDAFRAELRAAGQPWSRRGVISVAAGIVLLAVAQFVGQAAPVATYFFSVLLLAVVLVVVGWVMLILGMIRRRRWIRGQAMVMPTLAEPEQGAS
jgi:Mn2+/Fe2+ NRAMP family transporter